MKIGYLGHSCFSLTESTGTRIVTDPYGDIGYFLPRDLHADAVTVSHGHYDHCNLSAVKGDPAVFGKEGQYDFGGVHITAIKRYHDAEGGKRRGENLIFTFRMDGLEVCHLGDLGEACSPAIVGALLPVHVLLVPVGGIYTIDCKQAKEYVERLKPSVVIPMHYKVKELNMELDTVDRFLGLFREEERVTIVEPHACEIELSREDIGKGPTKIIVMERCKA